MHGCGEHNPRTKTNEPNHELGLWATIIWATIIRKNRETSYFKIYMTMHVLSQLTRNYFTPPIKYRTTPNNIHSRKCPVDLNDEPRYITAHNLS